MPGIFDKLVDVLIAIWKFFIPFAVVNVYEEGVVLRFGHKQRKVGVGFHWLIPFYVDDLQKDVVVLRLVNLPAQSLTTRDGKTVVIGGVARVSISDIEKALLEVHDVEGAVRDACLGAIGESVEKSSWEDMLKPEFRKDLLAAVRDEVREFGVKVKSVKLSDKAPSRAYRFHIDQFNTFKTPESDGMVE